MTRFWYALAVCMLAAGASGGALAADAARCVTVPGEGIVRITAGDLASWGFSGEDTLYVYTDGQPVNFSREGNGDVQLYSAPFKSLYARERAFMIANRPLSAWDASQTATQPAGSSSETAALSCYNEVCRVEEDQYYMAGLYGAVQDEEHWFYSTMLTPGRKLVLTANLAGPLAAGPARLVVALRGATDAVGGGANHSTAVSFNGVRVGEVVWGGLVRKEVGFDLPAGSTLEGANLVELLSQALPGVPADAVMVDWAEVQYPRALAARADRLNLGANVGLGQKVVVDGFTGADIVCFDVTSPTAPLRLAVSPAQSESGWSAEWNCPVAGLRRFAVAGPTGRVTPSANRAADPWTCRQEIACDYLVVTHENYLDQANRLAELHAGQGLRPKVYTATAVYDAFGGGQPLPQAIRGLAQFVKPRYLCLIGDATSDPKGITAPVTVGVLPSFFAQGPFFEEPSDNPMGCVDNGDEYPEVAVGRIPARSAAEATVMVDKAVARQGQSSVGESDIHSAMVIGDNAMPIFTTAADEISASFARWGWVERIPFASYPTTATLRTAIIAGWAKKPRYVVYVGHASSTTLGNNSVIRLADVPNLVAGEELPAGTILACLAGYFSFSNGSDSLAERMLKTSARGVCALVAPGGMSPPEGQRLLGRELAAAIADGRAASLGEALMIAKRRLPMGHGDVLRSFNLLGDPAIDDAGGGGVNPDLTAPSISAQPLSQAVNPGQPATFLVEAAGSDPLTYQWKRDGITIFGATDASYTVPAAGPSEDGAVFTVVVSNAAGQVVSDGATLTVRVPPFIATQPESLTVDVGQSATFAVAAGGTAPLAYQWRRNGLDISGATGASYTTAATTAGDDGAVFSVTVANPAGSVTSANAVLTVRAQPPSIVTQPHDQTVAVGQTATFAVVAGGTAPLSYSWMKNGVTIPGATAASYTTPTTGAGDNGAVFSVAVANVAGSVVSNGATLTVQSAKPKISRIANLKINEDSGTGPIRFTISDAETPADDLLVSAVWNDTELFPEGNVVFGGSGSERTLTMTPAPDRSGKANVIVTVSDGALTACEPFAVTVRAVNDPPVISEGDSVAVTMDEDGAPTPFSLTLHATDVDSATLKWRVSSSARHGKALATGTGSAISVAYTPAADFNGEDAFVVKVSDGSKVDTITVNVTVRPVNDAPVAKERSYSVSRKSSKAITLKATDVDSGALTYVIVTPPAHGQLSGTAPNLVYTPDRQYTGMDGFTFKASDGSADSNPAAITIKVK